MTTVDTNRVFDFDAIKAATTEMVHAAVLIRKGDSDLPRDVWVYTDDNDRIDSCAPGDFLVAETKEALEDMLEAKYPSTHNTTLIGDWETPDTIFPGDEDDRSAYERRRDRRQSRYHSAAFEGWEVLTTPRLMGGTDITMDTITDALSTLGKVSVKNNVVSRLGPHAFEVAGYATYAGEEYTTVRFNNWDWTTKGDIPWQRAVHGKVGEQRGGGYHRRYRASPNYSLLDIVTQIKLAKKLGQNNPWGGRHGHKGRIGPAIDIIHGLATSAHPDYQFLVRWLKRQAKLRGLPIPPKPKMPKHMARKLQRQQAADAKLAALQTDGGE